MALDLPPITALRQEPEPASRDDYQPPGITTNFHQDDVVDGYLSVFFFTGGFANDATIAAVPELVRSYVQHNLPPYSEQQNFREQIMSAMRVMDEQDNSSEFRDFTTPFSRRTLARAQTIGDFDDPGWSIEDMIIALIDDSNTLKRVRKHGYFPGVDNALAALKGFSSQYALPTFATTILAVQQTDRPQWEIASIEAAHTMVNNAAQVQNVQWSPQKLKRQQTLVNIVDRRSPPLEKPVNEPAPGVPTLPTITFEPQQPAPGVPTVAFQPPQPAPGVPVEQVEQIVEQKVEEIKQMAREEHAQKVEELKQVANIEHAQIIQQKEAQHQQEVEALKQVAEANHAELLRQWQEEARAEMMRIQAELDRTAQRLREKYAQVPPMREQYVKPEPAVTSTPTMPTLLDVQPQQKSGNTMEIDVGPPQPVVFVEPAPVQVEAPPLQAQTSLVKPSVAAVSTVTPITVSQASVAKVVEAKTGVAATVAPVNVPTTKYDTAPAVVTPVAAPVATPVPEPVLAPVVAPSPAPAPFTYIELPPEVRKLVSATRSRAQQSHKTELEKAKAKASRWWKAHPRAEAQDKALKNQKVVTKAADYVPSKTDFKGVDLLRNSKSRAKK